MSLVTDSSHQKPRISSINGECVDSKDCFIGSDEHRVCVDGRCQCQPNYYFDYINNRCKYFTCRLDKDCQSYDPNRWCDAYDGCNCLNGFEQNSVSLKCLPKRMIGSPCAEDSDCFTVDDSHRVCHQNTCICKLFYKYNSYSKQCLAKNVCDSDEDCQRYDRNRVCDQYGLCICDSRYYANSISDKCKKKVFKQFKTDNQVEYDFDV